jgi:hypothetical protein
MRNFHVPIAALNNNVFFRKFVAYTKVGPDLARMLQPNYHDYFPDHDKNATEVL